MGPPLKVKGQRDKKDVSLIDFQGVNVQAQRQAIKDNEFSWLENAMPIGSGNVIVTPQVSAVLANIGVTEVVSATYAANINGTDFIFAFTSLGSGFAVNLQAYGAVAIYTVNHFAVDHTFSGSGVVMTQWSNTRVMIGDPNNGLFTWDTVVLLSNGEGVSISIVNGGGSYTSNPTVSFTVNGGAVASATVNSTGQITAIALTGGGSGYTTAPTVRLVGAGTGAPTVTATVQNGEVVSLAFSPALPQGSGWYVPPTIYFDGGGQPGSGMAATAVETGGVVTSVTITNPGSGYLLPPNVVFSGGGGNSATALALVLAGPTNITTIATFSGRLWCGYQRTVNVSDVGSFSSFAGAGTSFTITDATLHNNITQLISANNFLYIFGDSSIDILGNVAVTGGVTSFTRTNITASIGSNLPQTIFAYYRALVFADQIGFYALSGATPEKVSDNLDRLYKVIQLTGPTSMTGGQVAINNILCSAFLFNFTDTFVGTGQLRPLLAIFFNKKWFFASQATSQNLTQMVSSPIGGVPTLYAWDTNNNLYQLFENGVANINSTIQTKLYDGKNPLIDKQLLKVGVGVTFSSTLLQNVTVRVDGEKTGTDIIELTGTNEIQFVNNLGVPINFVNNTNVVIEFTLTGYEWLMHDAELNGNKYVGLTITSTSAQMVFNIGSVEYEEGATW
jgi:hypothetical protein